MIEATRAARKLGRRFFAWFDSSGIPAVQKAKLEFTEQAQKLNQMGVPLADIFNAFDMPFPVRDWQRTWYKPIGLVDVTEDSLSGGPGSDDPSGADETGLLPEGESGPQSGRAASGASGGGDASTRASEATRARLHNQWRASWAGLEQAFRSRTRRHFFELRQQVLDNLKQAMPKAKSITKRELIDLMLFDVAEAQQGLVVRLAGFYRDAYRLGGSQSMEEAAEAAGKPPEEADQFRIDDPETQRKLRRRTTQIRGVDATLAQQLRDSLADGVEAGESVEQLSDRVKHKFNVANQRAATIARTEVGAAVEESRHEGRRQAGVPLKSWLSSRKETGRPTHTATERETMANPVPNNESFTIAGTGVTAPHPRGTGLTDEQIAEHGFKDGDYKVLEESSAEAPADNDRGMTSGDTTKR